MKHHHTIGAALARGHALLPKNEHHEPDLPGTRPPEHLTDRELKRRLCAAGPGHCVGCESACGYGREYLKRRSNPLQDCDAGKRA